MKQRHGASASLPSPLHLFFTVGAIVFIAEAAAMLILPLLLPGAHTLAMSIADASILIVLSAPFLWWFVVRPLRSTAVAEHRRAATVIEHAADGIITINEQDLVESFNPAATRLFGYAAEEVIGKPLTLLLPERYREAYQRGLERVRLTGESRVIGKTIEVHGRRQDGREVPLEISLATWKTEVGTFYTCIVRDISERKQAEERLRLQSAALESAANAILVADRQGRIIWVNPAFTRLTGYTQDEVLGQNPRLLKSSQHDQPFYQNLWETILSGQVWHGKIINRRKDGSLYTEEQTITPVRGVGGEIDHFIAIKLDVTERKWAEEALHALYGASLQIQESLGLQQRLDRLLQTAQTVLDLDRVNILLADPEGRMLQAVASHGVEEPLEAIQVPIGPDGGGIAQAYLTRRMIVWDGLAPVPEQLRPQPPYDPIAAFRSQVLAIVPLVVQGRVIGVLGADRKHSRRPLDGATLELLQLFSSQAAVAIEQGQLYEAQRMAAIQLEATVEARTKEIQTANLSLEEGSRHKSEFLAHMSHELRTPLNSIIGFSELLQDPTFGTLTAKQAHYAQNILVSGQHLLGLINDLLDLSKVEAGKFELQPEPFSLPDAIKAAFRIIWPQAEAKQQVLEFQVADDLPTIRADLVRFKQILCNLLSNAVKFTPDAGRITVTAQRGSRGEEPGARDSSPLDPTPHTLQSDEFVELAVQDTGIGIRPEDLPKLFQSFTQIEHTFATRYQGTGLGLALTKQLVELHGDTIWAESAGEGQGSTFTIRLPLGPPGEAREEDGAHDNPGCRG